MRACGSPTGAWPCGTFARASSLRQRDLTKRDQAHRGIAFVNGDRELACEVQLKLRILDVRTLKPRADYDRVGFYGVENPVASPDGAMVAGASLSDLAVWDVAKGEVLWHKDLEDEKKPRVRFDGLAFSPDGRWLVTTCSQEGRVWRPETGELVREVRL